jgi:multidrug efflux pump subunit AcrA (membrane-fusion protein)
METEVDVDNADLSLTPGMYADTTLELDRKENALAVPVQAVIQDAHGHYVLVVDDQDRVRRKEVELGEQTSNRVEIVHGLAENERVIIGGQSNYQIGEVVKPRPEPESVGYENQSGEQK